MKNDSVSVVSNQIVSIEGYELYTQLGDIVIESISDDDNEYVRDYYISHVNRYNWEYILEGIEVSDKEKLIDELNENFEWVQPFEIEVSYTNYDASMYKFYMKHKFIKLINKLISENV